MKRELQRFVLWRSLQLFLLGVTFGSLPAALYLQSLWIWVPPIASALALGATLAGVRDTQRYQAMVRSIDLVKVPQLLTVHK